MKTHTLALGKYYIETTEDTIDGFTEVPGDEKMIMCVPTGKDFHAFKTWFHECLHGMGIPDKYLHDSGGYSKTDSGARLLWRWIKENKP
jgi:hypothetical protein